MILTVPTINLYKGKSLHTLHGIKGLSSLGNHLKDNPLHLAKIFRKENNKSILLITDFSVESLKVVEEIVKALDIPLQVLINNISNINERVDTYRKLGVYRFFVPYREEVKWLPNVFPILSANQIINSDLVDSFARAIIDSDFSNIDSLLDFTNQIKSPKTKFVLFGQKLNTNDLIRLNINQEKIDCVILGSEYYGVNFAGQKLWRIAEKESEKSYF